MVHTSRIFQVVPDTPITKGIKWLSKEAKLPVSHLCAYHVPITSWRIPCTLSSEQENKNDLHTEILVSYIHDTFSSNFRPATASSKLSFRKFALSRTSSTASHLAVLLQSHWLKSFSRSEASLQASAHKSHKNSLECWSAQGVLRDRNG